MHAEQRNRTRTLLQEKGFECALFANRESVGWLTGFVPPVNTGPNPFAGAPPLVWYEAGKFTLIVLDGWGEAAADFGKEPDGALVTYPTYTIHAPIQGPKNLLEVLKPIFKSGRSAASIGVELTDVNASTFIAPRVFPLKKKLYSKKLPKMATSPASMAGSDPCARSRLPKNW